MPFQLSQILKLIEIPFRRPRLLVLFTLLPAMIATVFGILFPPPFKSTAVVAMIKSRTNVSFDERIKTITGEDPIIMSRQSNAVQDRATELSTLVKNGAIAERVRDALQQELPTIQQDPRKLVGKIKASVISPGGMIAITAVDPDPEIAALLANTWASNYEAYVNRLYSGAPTGYSESIQTELVRSKQSYDEAQKALEAFLPTNQVGALSREISSKQTLLNLLNENQTTAISSTIEQQLESQALIINTYMSAQVANQLLAFNKQQEAKRNMLSQFIDAEIQARMSAIRRDQDLRQKAFAATSDADIDNKMAVIQQEAATKREALAQAYSEQTRLSKLLGNAQTMRNHVNQGGDSAAASNTLALLLLKTQIFSGQGTNENEKLSNLPGNLQLQASGVTATTAAGQLRDLDGVIVAIQDRIANLNAEIQTRSNELLDGTGYNFLSEFSANTVPVTTTPALSSTLAISVPLTTAIAQRYEELFDVGGLTQVAGQTSEATPLFAQIKNMYPDLFDLDAMSSLSQTVTTDNPLYKAALARTQELLELKNLQVLPGDDSSAAIASSFSNIQNEINTLQSQLEAENTKLANLTQTRDLAKDSFTTLSKKQEEVNISSAITGSEVRLAIPAMTAVEHTESRLLTIIMAGILGCLLGLVVSTALNFLIGSEQLLSEKGRPEPLWTRAFRWLVAPVTFPARWIRTSGDTISPQGGRPAAS